MAKNKRKPSFSAPQQQASVPKTSSKLSGLLGAVHHMAEVAQVPRPAWTEAQLDGLQHALIDERKQEFQALLDNFLRLGKDAGAAVERAAHQAGEHAARLADIEARGFALAASQQECDRLASSLASRERACQEREALLIQQDAALAIREENAAVGFLRERAESTHQLRAELEGLAMQRLALQAQFASLGDTRRMELEEKVEAQLQALRARELALEEQAAVQEVTAVRLASGERALLQAKRTGAQIEAMVRQELDAELSDQRAAQAAVVARLQEKLDQLRDDNDVLYEQIDEYVALEDALNGREPVALLDELEQLRRAVNDHARTIRNLEAAHARDDSDAVRAERDQLADALRTLRPELAELRQQSHRDRMGVMEKEQWALDKRMLQKSKELLEKGLLELEGRIRSLTEDAQHQGTFPELVRMDRDNALQLPAAVQAVGNLASFTEELRDRIAASQPANPLYFGLEDLQLFVGGLAMSQLHVFQGISGTGKTSLAKAFASVVGGSCTDIAVQAGWRDRADLLGHYNAFEKRYYEKDALQALYRAQTPAWSDRINVVLLDEMNLSRPEQYFADFLSALEKAPDQRLIPLMESRPPDAPGRLRDGRTIWVPENVWFIGTANQDETTNELADKTHDRAFVMELRSRHKDQQFVPRKYPGQATYSFQSLTVAFSKAYITYRKEVQDILAYLGQSALTRVLEARFGQGWGNRLERQAMQFLPVVKSAGGTFELALDHLLATRMFRTGKVTGRYDIEVDDLRAVEQALVDTWAGMDRAGAPERCLLAIEKDIKRRERGG